MNMYHIYHEIHANPSMTYENLNSLDRAIYEMIAALRDFQSNPHYHMRLARLYLFWKVTPPGPTMPPNRRGSMAPDRRFHG
jgi:hypothetical protein